MFIRSFIRALKKCAQWRAWAQDSFLFRSVGAGLSLFRAVGSVLLAVPRCFVYE